jgi:hypothetical protein
LLIFLSFILIFIIYVSNKIIKGSFIGENTTE